MGRDASDRAKEQETMARAMERGEEAYRSSWAEFERLMVWDEPEGGATLMHPPEEMTRNQSAESGTSFLKS